MTNKLLHHWQMMAINQKRYPGYLYWFFFYICCYIFSYEWPMHTRFCFVSFTSSCLRHSPTQLCRFGCRFYWIASIGYFAMILVQPHILFLFFRGWSCCMGQWIKTTIKINCNSFQQTGTDEMKRLLLLRGNDLLAQSSTQTLLDMLKSHAGIKECSDETAQHIKAVCVVNEWFII